MNTTPRISKITVGRLYNLGSYEHIRYELTVDVPDGESAAKAIIGIEKILIGLKPEKTTAVPSQTDLKHEANHIEEMIKYYREHTEEVFDQKYGHYEGSASEYITRCQTSHQNNLQKRMEWETREKKARILFDDLGGASEWKDCKLDWETDDEL